MFTGLIEDIGTLRRIERGGGNYRVTVACGLDTSDLKMGESIAVNGACFTVVAWGRDTFTFEASPESLAKTTLAELSAGARVHLERAMVVGGRLGGHIVQGHVDGVGHVLRAWRDGNAWMYLVQAPPEVARYLVPKGSIAVDGVSLTVNAVVAPGDRFELAIIPHTADETLLTELRAGARVNLEADVVGKYIHSLLSGVIGQREAGAHGAASPSAPPSGQGVTLELLRKHGFTQN